MSAEDTAPPPAGPSPALDDVGSSDKGEDTEVDAVTGLPVSFSGVFNTRVTDTNVPTVLSKLQKWGDYESYGEPVGPSRFIPMKTPLSPTLLADLGVGHGGRATDRDASNDDEAMEQRKTPHVHTLPEFLAAQKRRGRDVGLVIDLSNHDCLYSDGIPETGVRRVHVRNVAKSVPGVDAVAEVIATAHAFWNETDAEKYVAIHCAYGFNRTGFVLCCYLVEKCGLSAEQALRAFAEARKPGVKHERFREALRRRYPSESGEARGGDGEGRQGEDARPSSESGDARAASSSLPEHTSNETPDLDIAVAAARGGGAGERWRRFSTCLFLFGNSH